MLKIPEIVPVTDLRQDAAAVLERVRRSAQPVVITQNGKPRVVLMDVEQHDRLQDTLAMLKLLSHSQASLAQTGRVCSTAEVRRRAKAALKKAAAR